MTELKWQTTFSANDLPKVEGDIGKKMVLKGVLIDSSENKNRWMVSPEDFGTLAKDFIGKQLRIDHGEKVADVLGLVSTTEVDMPHNEAKAEWDPATPYHHIHFSAEISCKDDNISIPIKMGYVDHVSPTVDAKKLLCARCGKSMIDKNMQTCDCKDTAILIKDIAPRELSIVASPAYQRTVIVPYGFAASVNKEISKVLTASETLSIVEDELSKRANTV